jgi:hypothetical protein
MSDHPRPMRCQTPAGGCLTPPVFLVTHQTAPLSGRFQGPGLTYINAFCRSHVSPFADKVRLEGGSITACEDLPALPELALPLPIGLDAMVPVAVAETVPPKGRRRTKGAR